MTAAAFRATYSDWKLIRSRKVVQLVFEVPVETAGLAYEVLGGMPNPAAEVWCAIARLNPGAEPVQPQAVSAEAAPTMKGERSDSCSQHIHAGPHQADNPSPSGGDRRKWDELPYSQRAAIRCQEPAFIKWLDEHYGYVVPDADAAARVVRELCGVETRTNILPGTPAGDKWQRIDSDFMLHRFGAMT